MAELRAGLAAARAGGATRLGDRALWLVSREEGDTLRGDIHAISPTPYDEVRQALRRASAWCELLILHLNVKFCRAEGSAGEESLVVGLGRKFEQPLGDAHWIRLAFRQQESSDRRFAVGLQAAEGPLGTRNYRIALEAAPQGERETLLHVTYAYQSSWTARAAMQVYLATAGSDKVGFSREGAGAAAPLVGGMRGSLERNAMRYYLAIEAWLGTLGLAPAERQHRALEEWFSATERYPRQLQEVTRKEYIAMKTREIQRQQSRVRTPLD
ncbi:MAG: hypothetical protein KGQ67_03770 [Betaproteobacteria bacterium]|nr:hypothetical protein [Betaproteobacteria bacterium]